MEEMLFFEELLGGCREEVGMNPAVGMKRDPRPQFQNCLHEKGWGLWTNSEHTLNCLERSAAQVGSEPHPVQPLSQASILGLQEWP